MPFRALRGTETCIKNGITTVTDVRHQCITAMGEYSGLSFEELRLQYDKYNCIKQTGCLLRYVVAFYVLECILVMSLYSYYAGPLTKKFLVLKLSVTFIELRLCHICFDMYNPRTCCKMFSNLQCEILGFHHGVVKAFRPLG